SVLKSYKKYLFKIDFECKGVNKKDFLSILEKDIKETDHPYNLQLGIVTELGFRHEELKKIGEMLKQRPMFTSVRVQGKSLGLEFNKDSCSYTIEEDDFY